VVGWGPYSDIAYVLSASVPVRPPQPKFVAATSTSVTIDLFRTEDDGGSTILGYKLLVDSGNDFQSPFVEIARYDGSSLQFTATTTDDGLMVGKIYRFIFVAFNVYGDSEPSLEAIAGLGAKPPAPSAP